MEDRFRFRVWAKGNEKYIYDAVYAYDGNNYKGEGDNLGHIYCFGEYLDDQKDGLCVVEQCTGLKDKNGKLIYEGDIIELTDDDSFEKPKKTIVHWVEKDACFGLLATNKLYYGFGSYECENFEVIGNIHEDSHLLENSNNLC